MALGFRGLRALGFKGFRLGDSGLYGLSIEGFWVEWFRVLGLKAFGCF